MADGKKAFSDQDDQINWTMDDRARVLDDLGRFDEALAQRIPAGRLGRPDDLVGAAMLLCSDAGRYINGVNLFVDGGRSAV